MRCSDAGMSLLLPRPPPHSPPRPRPPLSSLAPSSFFLLLSLLLCSLLFILIHSMSSFPLSLSVPIRVARPLLKYCSPSTCEVMLFIHNNTCNYTSQAVSYPSSTRNSVSLVRPPFSRFFYPSKALRPLLSFSQPK